MEDLSHTDAGGVSVLVHGGQEHSERVTGGEVLLEPGLGAGELAARLRLLGARGTRLTGFTGRGRQPLEVVLGDSQSQGGRGGIGTCGGREI